MKTDLIPRFLLTLVLSATAIATDWEVDCLNYPQECVYSWQACAAGQTLFFSGPIGLYTNCCIAERGLGGTPTITIDPDDRTVQLWFKPPGPGICTYVYIPVCGLEGTVGPLPGGNWLFIMDYAVIPFYIDAPTPDPNLTLLAPKTGEYIPSGSTYTVKWTDSPGNGACAGSYILSYSTDLGVTWLPVDINSIDTACSYDWPIPLTGDDECALLIQDVNNPETYDIVEQIHIYDCNETIPGDLNADCYVDFRDYAILVSSSHVESDFGLILQLAEQWCDCGNPYDPTCGY
jgi:hypothetical protein